MKGETKMAKTNITLKYFHDNEAAREHLESIRWPNGPVCPHCGSTDKHYSLSGKEGSTKPVRKGVYKCKKCRKQFSVTVGTIFEDSHLPLSKWLLAIHLLCSSKKGMSAHQLHRNLGITYKSAWHMAHRIRHAMAHAPDGMMSGIVEVDETYVGGRCQGLGKTGRGNPKKVPVFALVERNGDVRSKVVGSVSGVNLKQIIRENVKKEATLMTDEFGAYYGLGKEFARHEIVRHSHKEYSRGDVSTNCVEGYFAILKRGITGIYHHVGKHHLHRYLAEFDFRYNMRTAQGINDHERAELAIIQTAGKRLMYKQSVSKTTH
jgi:transposase-like protein